MYSYECKYVRYGRYTTHAAGFLGVPLVDDDPSILLRLQLLILTHVRTQGKKIKFSKTFFVSPAKYFSIPLAEKFLGVFKVKFSFLTSVLHFYYVDIQ